MSSITANATIYISVDPATHQPYVTTSAVNVNINNLDVSLDGIFGFFVNWIIGFFTGDIASMMEQELEQQIADVIGPAVEDILASLVLSADYDVPKLDGSGEVVTISMETDFNSINFNTSGGRLVYRTVAYTAQLTPYDNLGAPGRVGCHLGPQVLEIPGSHEIELSLSDDLVTQLFFAAWLGGYLEFSVPIDMLGITQEELEESGITDLVINLSGMLAPTPSDCGPQGDLEVHLGDLRVDASMNVLGQPLSVIGYASISFGLEISVAGQEIQVTATGLRTAQIEVNLQQEEFIVLEVLFTSLLYDFLTSEEGLAALLDNQVLATIPIPEIDLSTMQGMPPGSAILISPDSLTRINGNTVVGAHATGAK